MRPMESDMGCGLKAAGQTRIYWNGPFKIQLEPAAEIGISFRWANRWGARNGVPEPDLRNGDSSEWMRKRYGVREDLNW
jgi:hypothetical protein